MNAPMCVGATDATRTAATLDAWIDILLPADEYGPSGTHLGVGAAMWNDARRARHFQRLLDDGCGWLNDRAHKISARDFHALLPAQRIALAERAARQPRGSRIRQFFAVSRDEAMHHYYGDPRSWAFLGYGGPPQPSGFPGHVMVPRSQ